MIDILEDQVKIQNTKLSTLSNVINSFSQQHSHIPIIGLIVVEEREQYARYCCAIKWELNAAN